MFGHLIAEAMLERGDGAARALIPFVGDGREKGLKLEELRSSGLQTFEADLLADESPRRPAQGSIRSSTPSKGTRRSSSAVTRTSSRQRTGRACPG